MFIIPSDSKERVLCEEIFSGSIPLILEFYIRKKGYKDISNLT